jgi:hypothetical protein
MKKSLLNAGGNVGVKVGIGGWAIALGFTLLACSRSPEQAAPAPAPFEKVAPGATASVSPKAEPVEDAPAPKAAPKASGGEKPQIKVQPPASEVVPPEAQAAAAGLGKTPLALQLQPYGSDELFAVGGGGCGMSLWQADSSDRKSVLLFSGMGEGPQLLIKLEGEFVALERIEGEGEEFYGQFTQQRFRNLNGDLEVVTQVKLGKAGEIESVAIAAGTVTLTKNGAASQAIAVKGDAGC